MERYDRQLILPEIGEIGQRKFKEATVLIVGLGGLGSVVSTYLTGAGIGKIILADNDVVSLTNLQRQVLYTEDEIGLPKVECAFRRLSSQSSDVAFELVGDGLTSSNVQELIVKADIVVDCTDNFSTRCLIDDVCRELHKPWVYGAIGEFSGQVAVFGLNSDMHYRDLFCDPENLERDNPPFKGVLGPVPAVIGAVQSLEVLKMIAGFGVVLDGKMFTVDLLTMNNEIIQF